MNQTTFRNRLKAALLVAVALAGGVCQGWAVEQEEQIKFDIDNPKIFDAIKNQKKILTYKVKHSGEYVYEDYYYDTPDFALYRLGCSFRFRVRNKGTGLPKEYGFQFKHEYGNDPGADFKRQEIDTNFPEARALGILNGNWADVFENPDRVEAVDRFLKFLEENKVDRKALAPVIYGKQARSRYRLNDDGEFYFEVSMDDATYKNLKDEAQAPLHLYQLEFENKFRKDQSDMQTRIKSLCTYFERMGAKPERDSKYRTSVEQLLKPPAPAK